ncbi:hypothetical protein PR202_gb15975 [Eleusine coracana subsp. coracana]|uniref:Uncharacterized protein n=1 Tax=Eleusine coracana subsp. coracana TaxID=191504 RepID=A0AAV5EZ98_ELECO|nr:hypothetical protein PR202_gb15975 [Eleusine coracana subsp. coracana]
MTILQIYSRGSGQLVNHDKSAIFYSSNCTDVMKQEFSETMHIVQEALAERYLGLPTALGRSINDVFEYMLSKLKGLIGGWSEKNMSSAAKEVLIKSVAQSIPTYPMSCFKIPIETC